MGKVPVPEGSPQGERRLLVRPGGVRLVPTESSEWTVESRTFRGDRVVVRLRPADGPPLEAEFPLSEAPAEGTAVDVRFAVEDVVVLGDS